MLVWTNAGGERLGSVETRNVTKQELVARVQATNDVSVGSPAATPYEKSFRSENASVAAAPVSPATAVAAARQRESRVFGGIELLFVAGMRSNVMYCHALA